MPSSSSEGASLGIPNGDRAVVDLAKVRDYLLNPGHPDNAGKARFFLDAGFSANYPGAFADALRRLAASAHVMTRTESRYGVKYTVDGTLLRADGRSAVIRTIWIVQASTDAPRLVTAYPLGRGRG